MNALSCLCSKIVLKTVVLRIILPYNLNRTHVYAWSCLPSAPGTKAGCIICYQQSDILQAVNTSVPAAL